MCRCPRKLSSVDRNNAMKYACVKVRTPNTSFFSPLNSSHRLLKAKKSHVSVCCQRLARVGRQVTLSIKSVSTQSLFELIYWYNHERLFWRVYGKNF